jgi:8-oxo-dGTP diphosphatase
MFMTSRLYPSRPIPGVAGVILDGSRILLSMRGKPPSEGKWGLPGGAVEVGETVKEALIREILEETGVTVKPIRLITSLDSIHRDDDGRVRYHYVLFEYLCEYVSGEVSPGSDAPEARWVKLDELDSVDIMPSTKKFLLKVLRQENTSS